MSILEIRVPDIGGHDNVNVAEVYVKVGDKILFAKWGGNELMII